MIASNAEAAGSRQTGATTPGPTFSNWARLE
jgi:hypothetical protein